MQTFAIPTFAATPQSHPGKILAIGDSIVYGYGDTEGGGWVDRLKRQWMMQGDGSHVLYNLGVRGNTVKQVSDRLEFEFRQRGELRNRYPDALIVSVGVNDCPRLGHLQGRNLTSFAEFETNVAHLLENCLRLIPNRVLFVGMVPVDEEKMPFSNSLYFSNLEQYKYKEVTKQACYSRSVPYLDIFDLWSARGKDWYSQYLSADGLHPNSLGYQVLLADILDWEPMQKLALVTAMEQSR